MLRIKVLALSAAIVFGASAFAHADLYQWKDKEGVIHITDDLEKVPEKYRDKMKVRKSPKGKAQAPATTAPPAAEPAQPPQQKAELYGDYPLEWWMQNFSRIKRDVKSLEDSVADKKQFMSLFESGRRLGQTYSSSDVETYNRYKSELPEDEQRLLQLKDELDELRRKATIAGVPKEIRE